MAGTRGATGRRRAIALLAPGLLLGLLVAPAGSMAAAEETEASPRSTPAPRESPADASLAAGLIVKYAPGTPSRETPGLPTGADSVTVTDVEMGRPIDTGLRTIEFTKVETAAVAELAAAQLESDPAVISAEPDWIITLDNTRERISTRAIQSSATWGIDRIDQRAGLNATYDYGTTGAGVDVYVVDSGIRTTHQEFTGRISPGASYIAGGVSDCDGHGTHVSGTIAGTTYGVAKGATIVPVRVFDCSGSASYSTIINALAWIRAAHTGARPGVVNMSLGGPASPELNAAVQATVADGLVVVVAAGNEETSSCSKSPASAPSAITVNSSTSDDNYSGFSNYGSCSDLYAPGSVITSAWYRSDNDTRTISGTSMAAPHVAGAAARILEANPSLTPAQVWSVINSLTTPITFRGISGDPAKLLYVDPLDRIGPEPSGLSVTADYETLQVTWNAPALAAPTHYDVEYSTDSTTWTADDTTATTSATITGLNPANNYVVRVRSVTADDSSAWLTSSAVAPLARTAPAAVTGLGMVVDDSALQVSWTAPASNGGYPIAYYTVTYSSDDSTWIADDTVAGQSTLIDGLVNGTPYRVRVSAVNALGAGPSTLAGPVAPRTPSVPTAPQSFTITPGIAELALQWSAPADDGGRATTTYAIEYSSDNSSWQSIPAYGGTAHTIAGLSSATSYTVRVAAINSIGTGAWASAAATPLAPPPPPPPPPPAPAPPPPPPAPVITAPGAPTITEVGAYDRTIMALWLPSDDTGGDDPREYVVELAGPEGTQTRTAPIGFVEFDGLANGAAYRVRVAATNSAGTGDFSAWSDEVTPIGLAAAPTGLTGSAFDGGVDLRWTAPDDTGGAAVDEYIVTWISDGIEVAMTTEQTAIRLETLANGTRYDFFVAAHTEAGIGQWSAPLSLTPRAAPVSAPGDVTAQRAGERLVVTWTAPVVGDPTRYVVAASLNGGPYRIKRSVQGTRVVLSVPKRTISIAVRVLAIDSYGRGPWSEPARPRGDSRR